jgi:type IV fimbrial biogenesis protein FimT
MSGVVNFVTPDIFACMKMQGKGRREAGVTLVELVITVSVLSILVAVAAPAIGQFVARSAMQGLQNDFTAAMNRARLDAISRNTCVSVCPLSSSTANTCEATAANQGNWHQGWITYVNAACGAVPAGGPAAADIIAVREPGAARYTLIDQGGSPPAQHTFSARGLLRWSGRTLTLADTGQADSPHARCLRLSMQGRLMAEMPASGGGC